MGKLLILLIFVSCSLFFVWQGIYSPKNPISQAEKVFLVEKGEGTKEISVNLEKENLIKYGFLFRTYALIAGKSGKLQAGEYLLSPAMNIPQITEKLSRGEVVKKELTVPEGFTLDQIEERLKISDLKDRKIKEYKEDYQFLKDAPSEATLEGYLFPDTYQLSYQAAADEIVRKMLNNFDKKLTPDLREEIKNQEKTIYLFAYH